MWWNFPLRLPIRFQFFLCWWREQFECKTDDRFFASFLDTVERLWTESQYMENLIKPRVKFGSTLETFNQFEFSINVSFIINVLESTWRIIKNINLLHVIWKWKFQKTTKTKSEIFHHQEIWVEMKCCLQSRNFLQLMFSLEENVIEKKYLHVPMSFSMIDSSHSLHILWAKERIFYSQFLYSTTAMGRNWLLFLM